MKPALLSQHAQIQLKGDLCANILIILQFVLPRAYFVNVFLHVKDAYVEIIAITLYWCFYKQTSVQCFISYRLKRQTEAKPRRKFCPHHVTQETC